MVLVARDLKDLPQPLCCGQGYLSWDQVAQSPHHTWPWTLSVFQLTAIDSMSSTIIHVLNIQHQYIYIMLCLHTSSPSQVSVMLIKIRHFRPLLPFCLPRALLEKSTPQSVIENWLFADWLFAIYSSSSLLIEQRPKIPGKITYIL